MAEAIAKAEGPEAVDNLDDGSTAFASTETSTAFAAEGEIDEWLASFERRRDVAVAVCSFAGVSPDESAPVEWRVGQCTLSVRLWPDPDGRYLVRVLDGWPTKPRPRSLLLADVFAIATTGTVKVEPGPSRSRWRVMMLVDLGFVQPGAVALESLPDDAPEHARRTWELVERLLSYRRVKDGPEEPFAFSAPTIARWFGVAETKVRNGKWWLEGRGFLIRAGTQPSRYGQETVLWIARERLGTGTVTP